MKPIAIIYTSNTGYTEQYARLLSEQTGLPAYTLKESKLEEGSAVIYLGWLMAGTVKGYKKAAARYELFCVCAVGMGKAGSQLRDVREINKIPDTIRLFTLQGGFDLTKLRGIYKFMMTSMMKSTGKKLAEKPDKTPEEGDMLDLLMNGGNRVSAEALKPVLELLNS